MPISLKCWFIGVNFPKLTDSNLSFNNYFVCIHYRLSKISTEIASFFSPLFPEIIELSITLSTLWSYVV